MLRFKTLFVTVVLLMFAYAFFYPNNYFIKSISESIARKVNRIKKTITEDKDVLFLFRFDKPDVVEWISGKRAISSGTVTVPAKNGFGRKFDGREKTHIEFPVQWDEFGNNYTIAMWINISDHCTNQYILYNAGLYKFCGFYLDKGSIVFDVPSTQGRQYVSYPFTKYNEFVHIAASVDMDRKEVKIYENGKIKAKNSIHMVNASFLNVMIGKPMWYEILYPFKGIMESIIVWKKVLSPKEIKKLANSKNNSLLTLVGYSKYYNLRLNQLILRVLKTTTRFFDLLKSATIGSFNNSFNNYPIPEIHIMMSGQDRRHFVNSHRRSRLSGRRIRSASRYRNVKIIHDKKAMTARIKLDGTNTDYNDSKRPSYIVETQKKDSIFGFKKILLAPPESSGFLLPIVNTNLRKSFNLPFIPNGFCKLKINGMFQGFYYFEDFNRMGILSGEFQGICDGIALHQGAASTVFDREKWPLRIEKSGLKWPMTEEVLYSLYDDVYKTYGDILLHDIQSPLTQHEKLSNLITDKSRVSSVWQIAPPKWTLAHKYFEFLNEFMVLGKNDSPYRLVSSLDLKSFNSKGIQTKWKSSDQSILRNDGTLIRPKSGGPLLVSLKAIIDDGIEIKEKTLNFRVMPEQIEIPTLMIYTNQTPKKTLRVDAHVEVCEINEDTPTRFLTATQGKRGGINHRGNTSFFNNKKLFLLKTDEPHYLITKSDSRVLKTINSRTDKTFIKNRLAYDLFRSFSSNKGKRIAPYIRLFEVFVNGYYHGLFECVERLKREPDILYKHNKINPHEPYMKNISQQLKNPFAASSPYNKLEEIMKIKDTKLWVAEVEKFLDVDSMIDMQILLNFTQNLNGNDFNFSAHEILAYTNDSGGYFYYIPWDFDATFDEDKWRWIANSKMRRLRAEYPDYMKRLTKRWQSLRSEVLDIQSVLERIDELALTVKDYAKWDYLRWGYFLKNYEKCLNSLNKIAQRNIMKMDDFLLNGEYALDK